MSDRQPLTIVLEPECSSSVYSSAPTVHERHYDTDKCLEHIYSKYDSQITLIPVYSLFNMTQFEKVVKNVNHLTQVIAFHILCDNTEPVDQ